MGHMYKGKASPGCFGVAVLLFVLLWLGVVGGIIYVILHFVAKFW